MNKQLIVLGLIIFSGVIVACRTQTEAVSPALEKAQVVATVGPEATATPLPTVADTPTVAPTATPTEQPTDTPLPPPSATPTASPTITLTPTATTPPETPTPTRPSVTVEVDLNVRAGPDTSFQPLGLLAAGTVAEVVARSEDGDWWQISYPQGPDGLAWISANFGQAKNAVDVPIAISPPTPIPPTPAPPTPTTVPTQPPIDFVIVQQRLWTNEENGGFSPGGSVANCGYGHEIYVTVIDAAGNPLDGIIIGDTYNNPKQITGSHGPGRTLYVLFSNGYNLLVAEDQSAGRPVSSQTSHVLSAKDEEIPIPWLISSHYCANEAECQERVGNNSLCRGHYSYDIVFQRSW